jgi:hypothetical protein
MNTVGFDNPCIFFPSTIAARFKVRCLVGRVAEREQFEQITSAEAGYLRSVQGDKGAHDLELRPQLMVQAIEQLQDAHVEADVWKIEGLDRPADCDKVVAIARRNGRPKLAASSWGEVRTKRKFATG